jgi:hypothetical protein
MAKWVIPTVSVVSTSRSNFNFLTNFLTAFLWIFYSGAVFSHRALIICRLHVERTHFYRPTLKESRHENPFNENCLFRSSAS